MSIVDEKLTAVARKAIERLDLTGAFRADLTTAAKLSLATAGKVGLYIEKRDGYWAAERWVDGEMVEAYVGARSVADALDRIGEWMRAV